MFAYELLRSPLHFFVRDMFPDSWKVREFYYGWLVCKYRRKSLLVCHQKLDPRLSLLFLTCRWGKWKSAWNRGCCHDFWVRVGVSYEKKTKQGKTIVLMSFLCPKDECVVLIFIHFRVNSEKIQKTKRVRGANFCFAKISLRLLNLRKIKYSRTSPYGQLYLADSSVRPT